MISQVGAAEVELEVPRSGLGSWEATGGGGAVSSFNVNHGWDPDHLWFFFFLDATDPIDILESRDWKSEAKSQMRDVGQVEVRANSLLEKDTIPEQEGFRTPVFVRLYFIALVWEYQLDNRARGKLPPVSRIEESF